MEKLGSGVTVVEVGSEAEGGVMKLFGLKRSSKSENAKRDHIKISCSVRL